jgi:4-hydroxybenzoate polyprenyltransferase
MQLGVIDRMSNDVPDISPTPEGIAGALDRDTAAAGRAGSRAAAVITLLRPHQWVKNVLLFFPLLLAHIIPWRNGEDLERWLLTCASFAAFCFTASSVYVINDLLDADADRLHHSKRRRPFASGALPRSWGMPIAVALLAAAAGICLGLPRAFGAMLLVYCLLSNLYSFRLKRLLLVDVFVLAGLYTLRIVAGGLAVNVPVTSWLLAFAMFLFVSLAFAKRYTELAVLNESGGRVPAGRNYRVEDLRIIESVGPASGYLAVMVLALYINDTATMNSGVLKYYPTPFFLWLLCPLLMYWITRIWFYARRGDLHDDPILFAIKDHISWMTLAMAGLLVVAASLRWADWLR